MLTREQIRAFHADGFLILRGLFAGEELRLLTEAVDEVQAQGIARQGDGHLYAKGPDGEPVYWRSERMWGRAPVFQAVTVKPALLEAIGQCVGEPFFPWNDSLVVKAPGQGAAVPWHQDPPYGNPARAETFPRPNFTTDIYLDHSGPDNGCVYAVPGHHLVGHADVKSRTEAELMKYGAVPVEMEAGDVLFHALSAPHGSAPNRSGTQRRIFYVHYLCDAVFRDAYGVLDEDWVKSKPGWGPERKALVEGMLERRRAFGWEGYEETGTLAWGEGGFLFTGEPRTPPAHWGELAARIPPAERARKKALA